MQSHLCDLSTKLATSRLAWSYRVAKTHRIYYYRVISRKKALQLVAVLRQMTLQLKASYGSAPPCTPFHKHRLPTLEPYGLRPSWLYQNQSDIWTFDVYCFHLNYGHLHHHIEGFIVDDAQCGAVWRRVVQCEQSGAVWRSVAQCGAVWFI